jgi:hypothetical protein
MGLWNKVAVIITGIGVLMIIGTMTTLGLFWGMIVEMVVIIGIVTTQNVLGIAICWFASRNQYNQLRLWLIGSWLLNSFIIASLFLIAVIFEDMWVWAAISFSLEAIETITLILALYVKANPKT